MFQRKIPTKDAPPVPRKKGIRRFFQVLARDLGNVMANSILHSLTSLPMWICGFVAVLFLDSGEVILFGMAFLAALLMSLLAIPGQAASYHAMSRSLQDNPHFFLYSWRRAFAKSFKKTALLGLVGVGFTLVQVITLYIVWTGEGGLAMEAPFFAVALAFLILIHAFAPYYFLQAAYLDLKKRDMLKNSAKLMLSSPNAAFGGGLFAFAMLFFLLVGFFPISIPPALIILIGVFALGHAQMVWPVVNRAFGIEEKEIQRRAETQEKETK